jgi:hypothetical protein
MTLLKTLLFSATLFLMSDSVVEWQVPTEHDFGEVPHKQRVKTTFTFKNVSGEPFVIDNVRTPCGCTAPDWVETPIMPDSLGVINLEFTAKQKGYFEKTIKVYLSNQRKAEKLVIYGDVIDANP